MRVHPCLIPICGCFYLVMVGTVLLCLVSLLPQPNMLVVGTVLPMVVCLLPLPNMLVAGIQPLVCLLPLPMMGMVNRVDSKTSIMLEGR